MKQVRAADFDPNTTRKLESSLEGMPAIETSVGAPPAVAARRVLPVAAGAVTANQAAGQSPGQSTGQPQGGAVGELTERPSGRVVGRPKSFYITERLDHRLNEAVRYFKARNIHRVDRSTVLNAMLDKDEQFREESLAQLVDRVVSQLASRLTD